MTSWSQDLKDKIINFQAKMTSWSQDLKDKIINFQAKMTSWSQRLKNKVISFKAKMTSWSNHLKNKVISFKAKMTSWSNHLKDKVIDFKAKMTSWSQSLKDKVIEFKAKMTSWSDHLKDKVIDFKAKLTSWSDHLKEKTLSFKAKLTSWFKKKEGGVYSNGKWSPVPQYASGGRPHGSMFVAGEAGPEMVGHVGGRTEVLNKSQLASTMNAAVVNGMNAVSNNLASVLARTMSACTGAVVRDMSYYLPCLIDVGNGIRSDTAQLMAYARQAEAASGAGETAEVVTILKKILEILLAMDPDIYIDGQKITARIISIINAQTRATGKSAIVV
jgi:hypothetical protein